MVKKISFISLALGLFSLFIAGWPLLQYQIWEMTQYKDDLSLISPSSRVLGISTLGDFNSGNFGNPLAQRPYDKFSITISKMKLVNEEVLVDSDNFDQHLAHLSGVALPGEKGNVFITGHSSVFLWQLGNKRPIFNNLTSLQKGDQVEVNALGQNFVYIVEGRKVVDPIDTYVINPPDSDGRYLTLMTCVPPGFNSKRLVVLTKLSNL